jgi:hypothetical protein
MQCNLMVQRVWNGRVQFASRCFPNLGCGKIKIFVVSRPSCPSPGSVGSQPKTFTVRNLFSAKKLLICWSESEASDRARIEHHSTGSSRPTKSAKRECPLPHDNRSPTAKPTAVSVSLEKKFQPSQCVAMAGSVRRKRQISKF